MTDDNERTKLFHEAVSALRGYRNCCYRQLDPAVVGALAADRIDSIISTTILAVRTAEETVKLFIDDIEKGEWQ